MVARFSSNSETLRDLELSKGLLSFVFYHVKVGKKNSCPAISYHFSA